MLANIDFLMATAVQVTKILLCLLVWGNCLSNRLLAWLSTSVGATSALSNHEGGWRAKNICHLGWNSWSPQREQHDLILLQRYGLWVHRLDSNPQETNAISVAAHLPVSPRCMWHLVCHQFTSAKVVSVSIPVLKPLTTTSFLRRLFLKVF